MRLSGTKTGSANQYNGLGDQLYDLGGARPTLDLNFANNGSLVDSVTGKTLVQHTRASSATYVDGDGVIRTATTNLLLKSEDLTVSPLWVPSGSVTATADSSQGLPFTGASVYRVDYSDADNSLSQPFTYLATNYTASVWVKGTAGETIRFAGQSGVEAENYTLTGEWQHLTLAWTATANNQTFNLNTFQGVTARTIYVAAPQLEQSTTVGEYIPTTSTINSAPRFDHDPTTGESLGLLVEEARTNVVTWSQDFSQADWTKNASTVVTTAIASPIQGVNYRKIEATSANTTVGITSVAVTAATQQRAVSFFAQPLGNISRLLVVVQGADARINVNLADGTFTTNAAATGSTVAVSGQRFSVSTPTLTNATSVRFFLKQTGDTDTNTPTTIAIGEGLYLIGAQMEAGAFPTSYIPTTGATATRAADVASISGNDFGVTNLLTRSEEFDNASWLKTLATVTPNAATAPNGSVTADKLIGNSTIGSHYAQQTISGATNGISYTSSVYAKASEITKIEILHVVGTILYVQGYDLSSGTLLTRVTGGTTEATGGFIQAVGDGWYRCGITQTSDGSGTTGTVRVTLRSANTVNFDATSQGVLIWGAQLEQGNTATPYIKSDVTWTSRASNATYYDSTGLLKKSSYNLLLRSEEFDTTWTASNASVSGDAQAAPNGTITADKLIEAATSSTHNVRQIVTTNAALPHAFSVYVKAAERSFVALEFVDSGATGNGVSAYFNLSLGSASNAVSFGNGSGGTASIISVGNGWFRCLLSGVPNTSGTAIRCNIYSSVGVGTANYTGDGTSGIYIWGAQLETGTYAGDYAKTEGSAASTARTAAYLPDGNGNFVSAGELLLEGAGTNLALDSEDLSTATWNVNGFATITSGFTSPRGDSSAYLVENATDLGDLSGQDNLRKNQNNNTPFANLPAGTYTISGYVKANGATTTFYPRTRLGNSGVNNQDEIGISTNWQRFTRTVTATVTDNLRLIFAADNSDGFYLWGVQVEASPYATSYIPTSGSTATRAADVSTSAATFGNSWYNASEGSLYGEAQGFQSTASTTALAVISDATVSNRWEVDFRAGTLGGAGRTTIASNGSNSFDTGNVASPVFVTNQNYKIASAAAANNFGYSFSGGVAVQDSSGAMPISPDQIEIGNRSNALVLNGTIRRLTYWPTRLSNDTLQTITT